LIPQSLTDLKSIEVGEQDVTDNDVKTLLLREAKSLASGARPDNVVMLGSKSAAERLATSVFVLDEENPHQASDPIQGCLTDAAGSGSRRSARLADP
jgi:hypothetical protein